MSVTITRAERIAGGLIDVAFTSTTDGPYRIIRDGVEIGQTYMHHARIHAGMNEAPVVEILDDPEAAITPVNSARFVMAWGPSPDTAHYRVERYNGATWDLLARIKEEGLSRYTFRTPTLDDSTTHQLRIVPVGRNGNSGTALTMTRKMARHPDPPNVVVTYNGVTDRTLNIAEA